MKIYTRTGDKGTTALIGGRRLPKHHLRIEAYGTVDELISFIGLLRDQEIGKGEKLVFLTIQERLMRCASLLASDPENKGEGKIPSVHQKDIEWLENGIDEMEKELPPLKSFVLSGGHPASSLCQVARTVCRRAERNAVRLSENEPVDEIVMQYLNRLADFLFVMSRKILKDFNRMDDLWQPDL